MNEFIPHYYRYMLHRQVMVVAKTRVEGTWKAYCFPVPGENHIREQSLWETKGAALPEKVARVIFGHLENMPYAR